MGPSFARFAFLLIVCLSLLPGESPAAAADLDPHRIYEESCARCHAPHAGPFVHEKLAVRDGKVIAATTARDVAAFLNEGHGGLKPQEVEALVAHFGAILAAGGLFQEKCRICHDRAVELARHGLLDKDGKLVGRYTGRDIAEFLQNHGRLEPGEVEAMMAVLRRQLR